ncbi:hypothetical protein Salat_1032100 [Sesamum alatum]|uniref:MADS-box domain-containing protein n=1 Tax=Sesamum alatum TaxID=300844 RepID=A0AAE1YMF6_9LAMI|nr:hypothetical protein Salat_1032100 [Sesamum alatum]
MILGGGYKIALFSPPCSWITMLMLTPQRIECSFAFLSRPSAILSNIEIFLMLSLDICSMHESNRNVIFGIRAEGLLKKGNELSILRGVDIGIIIHKKKEEKTMQSCGHPRNLWVEAA